MTYRFVVENSQKVKVIEIVVKGDSSDESHQRKLKQSIVDYLLDSGYLSFKYQDAEAGEWRFDD